MALEVLFCDFREDTKKEQVQDKVLSDGGEKEPQDLFQLNFDLFSMLDFYLTASSNPPCLSPSLKPAKSNKNATAIKIPAPAPQHTHTPNIKQVVLYPRSLALFWSILTTKISGCWRMEVALLQRNPIANVAASRHLSKQSK